MAQAHLGDGPEASGSQSVHSSLSDPFADPSDSSYDASARTSVRISTISVGEAAVASRYYDAVQEISPSPITIPPRALLPDEVQAEDLIVSGVGTSPSGFGTDGLRHRPHPGKKSLTKRRVSLARREMSISVCRYPLARPL